ncbi:MAG TPA: VanW family protein [Candidatus Limnocylindrales bacterium]|nr:VanW family protein [Candidatus Limnocylindrales bacterium]
MNPDRPVEPVAVDPVADPEAAGQARPTDDPRELSAPDPADVPTVVSVEATSDGETVVAADAEPPAPDWTAPDPPSRRGRGLRWIGTFTAAFVAASIIVSSVGAAAIYGYRSAYDGRIPHGVDVGGVDVSGLDPASAEQRVAAAFASMTTGTIVLDAPFDDARIEFANFGRSVDAAAAADRAMAVAKDGDVFDQTLASARTAIDGVTIAPTVSLDPGLLSDAINRAVRRFERPARDAIVTSTPEGVLIQPGRAGLTVDREAIFGAALDQVGRAGAPASIVIPVSPTTIEPALTDSEAEAARQAVERMVQPIVVRHGEESWRVGAATVRPWIVVVPTGDGRVVYDIDREQVEVALKKLRSKIDREPVNAAYLTSKSGRVIGVKAGRNGRTIDAPLTSERIARAVISRAYGVTAESAKAAIVAVEPKLSTAEAEKTAPLLKMISSHTTWFPYGERNYYGANIWIPGRIINGKVLAPGETFNFFKVVGFPSASRGFGMGGAIINGKSEPTGALAGGICSNSTTLFNAAAKAGLKLGARAPHYYYIDRYPLGLDATVLFSSGGGGQNLTFTNDTKYPILIVNRNWRVGSRGYVRYEMWSVPNGRKVRFSRPIVKNIRPAGTDVLYTSALPPGVSRQEESAHDGMDVWVTRTVTEANGKVSKLTIYSHYRRVDGLILRGKAATGDNL